MRRLQALVDAIDILSLLYKDSTLRNVRVYGKIIEVISELKCMSESVHIPEDCVCVKIAMSSINLSKHADLLRHYEIKTKDCVYFVNGTVATFINKNSLCYDWFAFDGTLRLAKGTNNVVGLHNFKKLEKDTWGILPTKMNDITDEDFDTDGVHWRTLVDSFKKGTIIRTESAVNLRECLEDTLDDSTKKLEMLGVSGYKVEDRATRTGDQTVTGDDELAVLEENDIYVSKNDPLPYNTAAETIKENSIKAKSHALALLKGYDIDGRVNSNRATKPVIEAFKRAYKGGTNNGWENLVSGYLGLVNIDTEGAILGVSPIKYVLSTFDEVCDYMLTGAVGDSYMGLDGFLATYFSDVDRFCMYIFALLSSVAIKNMDTYLRDCERADVSAFSVFNTNVYLIPIVSNAFDFGTLEYMSECLAQCDYADTDSMRDVCVISSYLNNLRNSTCTPLATLNTCKIRYSIRKNRYESLSNTGFTIAEKTRKGIDNYFILGKRQANKSYQEKLWFHNKGYYETYLAKEDIDKAVALGIGLGVLRKYKDYIASSENFTNELDLYISGHKRLAGSVDNEDLGVISCQHIEQVEYVKSFIARYKPNYKIKCVTLTVNSMLQWREILSTDVDVVDNDTIKEDCVVFLLGATDITFKVLLPLIENTKIKKLLIFCDRHCCITKESQIIYNSLIKSFPCIVSDRSGKDTLCDTFLDNKNLYAANNRVQGFSSTKLVEDISTLVNNFESAKQDYKIVCFDNDENSAGVQTINNGLHIIRSKENTPTFKLLDSYTGNSTIYALGDKVISRKAEPNMQWYSDYKYGKLIKTWGSGVCVGEVGTIVDYIESSGCRVVGATEEKPEGYVVQGAKNDILHNRTDAVFIVVEYKNYIGVGTHYVLYWAFKDIKHDNRNLRVFNGICSKSIGAYRCLTPDLLYECMSDNIIITMGARYISSDYNNKYNKSTLYRALSSTKDGVFFVGNVQGNGMIDKIMKQADTTITTFYSLL